MCGALFKGEPVKIEGNDRLQFRDISRQESIKELYNKTEHICESHTSKYILVFFSRIVVMTDYC